MCMCQIGYYKYFMLISAGVGRTGTIILCDICLRMAAKEKAIDVVYYLKKMREQRVNMVDNIVCNYKKQCLKDESLYKIDSRFGFWIELDSGLFV